MHWLGRHFSSQILALAFLGLAAPATFGVLPLPGLPAFLSVTSPLLLPFPRHETRGRHVAY